MNCIEFEAAVEHAVETREPLAPTMLEHTSTCTDCRQFWEVQQQLDAVIVAWRSAKPPVELVGAVLVELAKPFGADSLRRIESRLEQDDLWANEVISGSRTNAIQAPSATTRKSQSGHLAMASVAACVAFAVVFATQFSGQDRHELARAPQTRMIDRNDVNAPVDVSSTLTAVFSDLRSEYREMASETTSVAREMVNAIPHRVPVSALPVRDEIDLRPNPSDVVRMWQPIGSRVESALGFLWQAIPSEVPSG